MPRSRAAESETTVPDTRPMDVESTKLRGRIVDELQQRIHDLQNTDKAPPQIWREKLSLVVEADDANVVDAVYEWMVKELPPKEYHAAEITWDTYAGFANELMDRLTLYGARMMMKTGELEMVELASELITALFDVRDSAMHPAAAMAELQKIRGRALTELKRFRIEA